MKTKYLIASCLTALFLLTGCDSKSEIDESLVANSKNNKPVREEFISKTFKLTTTDEKIVELKSTPTGLDFKDYKDKKVVLVNVFATWCPPCIKEIPTLIELQNKYSDDFEIISVLFESEEDKPKKEVLEFIKKYNINYKITIGEENFKLAKNLGNVQKIPELFLFAKDGTFVKKFIGETSKQNFEKYIQIALEKK
ncbi:TlpA family protein disulfide reductase [Poseidonibacter sp.]|uniref:TlpA family protein disulfide reductase n=2 Tax=Poseidonibacter sp. TaxID=2321188 RepID=UPI003C735C04